MVAAALVSAGVCGGGRLLRTCARRGIRRRGGDAARARQRRRQQRLLSQAALPPDAGRPVAPDARRQPGSQPGLRARPGRHAHRPARTQVRRGLHPRCDHVHDHAADLRRAMRDGVRPLPAGRRRPLRAGPRARDVPSLHGPRRPRRRAPGSALPRVDLGPRPGRLDVHGGLRLPAAPRGRRGARRARSARRGALLSRGVAAPAGGRRLRGAGDPVRSTPRSSRASWRCSSPGGRHHDDERGSR